MKHLFHGLMPVCRKEALHIVRDRGTLIFALLLPMIQLFLFGFAIDTNIRQVPTVVLDESRTQQSRQLLERFAASDVFALRGEVTSPDALYGAIQAGKARVGIRIPTDYARRLLDGTTATVLVLVDGSDSTVAAQAVNTATGVALRQSLAQVLPSGNMPIDVRWVAAHVREWAVVTFAMLMTALLFSVYPLMQTALAMGTCSVLLGLALGSVQPMIMSTLHQITPEARHGEALGLRLMALNASSVMMPLLFGTAGAVVGVSVVFWAVGLAVGSGARQAWLLRPVAPH